MIIKIFIRIDIIKWEIIKKRKEKYALCETFRRRNIFSKQPSTTNGWQFQPISKKRLSKYKINSRTIATAEAKAEINLEWTTFYPELKASLESDQQSI